MRFLEMLQLRAPVLVTAREAVHEDDRRRAGTGVDEMHACKVGL
jgi:hypothetical protein